MPQEFQVLRCADCEKFQVHQTKKSKKWICKVCGKKQSYLRIYFTGSAPHCRSIVQENNFQAGELRTAKILAESPNYIFGDNDIEKKLDDEHNSYNPPSKRLKTETENSNAAEIFETNSACFPLDESFFFNPSCGTGECYNQRDINEEHQENLDSVQKQPLTTAREYYKELLHNVVPDSCDNKNLCSKPEVPKIKPHFVKNRGFKKILKAAENLS